MILIYYGLYTYTFTFIGNSAEYGGALFVADDTNSGTCASTSYKSYSAATECFIQALTLKDESTSYIYLFFENNSGRYSGSTLYGGLLDRCTISPFSEVYAGSNPDEKGVPPVELNGLSGVIGGVKFLSSNNSYDVHVVSSDAVRVCFCKNNRPDCNYQPSTKVVKKGERFSVSLVAVDHINNTVGNTTIRSALSTQLGGLGENQLHQTVLDDCTNLKFEVFSPYTTEELIIYAEGPCKDAMFSQRRLSIQFSPYSCPVGFQPRDIDNTKCVCECDSAIEEYITNCDPQTKTLVRKGNFWITYINSSTDNPRNNNYLIYPNCPLNYCYPPSSSIKINLNVPDGDEAQCANSRTGKLCGSCKDGYSLSLGSSRCIVCPSNWPVLLIAILIAAILAGIALVAMLLVLNLTVAVGTLNGIIFYANIVNTNSSTFLPFTSPNIFTVFISWLNLELGFDTCFFKGMDAFWKTLLQLAFPVYLISMIVVIITASEYSTRFARLIGKKNPVATLDTLLLLSFTKLLSIIIASLSFAVLNYPDNSYEVVWLSDATVAYFSGKHVIMSLIALLILLVGTVYTFLLFFWQWLLYYQHRKLLKWVRNPKLCLFLEPYHAPYTFTHRYWTGLLLFLRAVLYIVSAANLSNDPGVNLFAIALVMTGLLLLKGYSQGSRIYRKWSLDLLEMSCYVNLLLFCLAELFSLKGNRNRHVIAYISGSHSLTLCVVVFIYHIFAEFVSKTKHWKGLTQQNKQILEGNKKMEESELIQPLVTYSEVAGPGQATGSTSNEVLSSVHST